MGENHGEVADAKETLADTLTERKAHGNAEALRITVLEHRRRNLIVDDKKTLRAMDALITTFMARKNYQETEALNLELWNAHQQTLGKSHETSLDAQATQANVYWCQDRLAEAESLELDISSTRSAGRIGFANAGCRKKSIKDVSRSAQM